MTSDEVGKQLMNNLMQFKKLHFKNKAQHGLQPSEKHTLFIIKQLTENSPEGVKVTEISKTLQVSPPTVTQKITSLEEKGFINRVHSKKDRREVLVSISDEANDLIESMHYEFLQRCIGLADYLGVDQSEQFNKLLSRTYNFFLNYKEGKENTEE